MPTLTLQPAEAQAKDTWIGAGSPNSNNGVATALAVGGSTAAQGRALIQFDLSALPTPVTITSATLTLYAVSAFSDSPVVGVHRGLSAWYEGDGWGSTTTIDGSTWNYRNHIGSVAWAGGAGGGSGSDYAASPTDAKTVAGIGYYSWNVTADVQAWANGDADNYGWWLIAQTLTSAGSKSFGSGAYGFDTGRPELVIVYEEGMPPAYGNGTAAGVATVSGALTKSGYPAGDTVSIQPNPEVGKDTHIFSTGPNENRGINTVIEAGTAGGTSTTSRSLIQFPLAGVVPDEGIVISAVLRLRCIGEDSSTDYPISLHRGLTEWFEGNVAGSGSPSIDGSTWNYRNHIGSVAWAGGAGGAAGADWVADATAYTTITAPNAWYEWDVTPDVRGFVEGTYTNHGWWILGSTGPNSRKAFFSSDTSDGALRPELVVTYAVPYMRGNVAGVATVTGVMRGKTQAAGAAAGEATTFANLISNSWIVGRLEAYATVTGVLRAEARMAGSSTALATAWATGRGRIQAAGAGAGVATVGGHLRGAVYRSGTIAGVATVTGRALMRGYLRGAVAGEAWAGGEMWKLATGKKRPQSYAPDPWLYLTDGEDRFDLLDPIGGLQVCHWRPALAQYKGGGVWSDSPVADGRRLALRRFANAIEVMELASGGRTQDQIAGTLSDLMRWLERAADYWLSAWPARPVYLVSKAAYETNPRYAIVHTGSAPELEDIYRAPFFAERDQAQMPRIVLRLERGHWSDVPPGESACAPVSAARNWTVKDWEALEPDEPPPPSGDPDPPPGGEGTGGVVGVTGDIYCMVQRPTGEIVIGTGTGRVFSSADGGANWTQIGFFGDGAIVHAVILGNNQRVFAAVNQTTGGNGGVWVHTVGAGWTRVKAPAAGNSGYTTLARIRSNSLTVAAGPRQGLGSPVAVAVMAEEPSAWVDVAVPAHWDSAAAAAAGDYPLMITNPPGKTFGPEVLVGTAGNPTRTGLVVRRITGGDLLELTNPELIGSAGKAAAGFHETVGAPEIQQRFLWAVKGRSNPANTEIWRWPHPAHGIFPAANQLGLAATVAGEEFESLYVDPAPSWTATQRTIWAGANGKIFVSFNSGFTWVQFSSNQTGKVRCFQRLADGRMLAGGDGARMYLLSGAPGGGGSVPIGGDPAPAPAPPPAPPAPSPGGGSSGGSSGGSQLAHMPLLGALASCEEAVRVSNKSSYANLTHVLRHHGGVWSELQYATEPPYLLLGEIPAVGSTCYFGCRSDDPATPTGPFSSVVLEVSEPGRGLTLAWEYWNGSAWAALAVRDNTSAFEKAGIGSIHWLPPTNWAANAVQGVTAWWVRVRVTAVFAPVGPVHDPRDEIGQHPRPDRYIYTAALPWVEVGRDAVGGDLPALAQVLWRNQSHGGGVALPIHRLLIGLRTASRGDFFEAFLNCSDVQTPFGVRIENLSAHGGFVTHNRAPTGRAYRAEVTGSGDLGVYHDLLRITVDTTIANEYYGVYRAFLRVSNAGSADDWRFRLALALGSGGSRSVTRTPGPGAYGAPVPFGLIDLGAVRSPRVGMSGMAVGDEMSFVIQARPATTNVAVTIFDLILLPTDEWAGDFLHTNRSAAQASEVEAGGVLDLDSVTDPKALLAAYNRTGGGLVRAVYQPVANGEAILQARARQRLWFLAARYHFEEGAWSAAPEIAGSVRVNKVQRFLALRGKR